MIGGLGVGGEAAVFVQRGRHAQVLHLGQTDIVVRDQFQRFKNARLEGSLHRGKGHVRLFVVFVLFLDAAQRVAVGVKFGLVVGGRLARRAGDVDAFDLGTLNLSVFVHRAAKGGLEVDYVAQKDVFGQKFVAPDRDGLKGQRAFAKPEDHRVAARLDPFGDGDLALAGQQFDRAHFAQIHADRVVGAVERFGSGGRDGDFAGG
ncbi:hypothetical protein GALL_471380 [mine drainage metagenome]|uniref:Uncharacterized protein n=1 Tax=mine drainage metagenome TaxID=410659 RepID=A0A1J5PKB5_9ZZZZ